MNLSSGIQNAVSAARNEKPDLAVIPVEALPITVSRNDGTVRWEWEANGYTAYMESESDLDSVITLTPSVFFDGHKKSIRGHWLLPNFSFCARRGCLGDLIKGSGLWPDPVEVTPIAEEVVELPTPSWVSAYACDDYSGNFEAEISKSFCLRSEVDVFCARFVEQLKSL